MSALSWLLLTRMKNRLKTFFSKASNIIATVFIVAMMGLLVWSGTQTDAADFRPASELYGMLYALLIVVFSLTAYQGLGRGASLYSMADVQLLFTSPQTPRRILFYGLIQQLGSSLLVGFFLLFQYGWLSQRYAVSVGMLLIILLLYGLALFMGQLTAMVLYAWISGHPGRRKTATYGYFGLLGVFVLCGFLTAANSGKTGLTALLSLVDSPVAALFPVGGWLGYSFVSGMNGAILPCLAGLAGTALLAVLLVLRIGSTDGEYYEDVLAATARSHQAITAKKEGRAMEALPENVKVGATGLGGGWGASAIFFKHRLEARRGRRFLLDTSSMIFVLMNIVFAFFMRSGGMLAAFIFATYTQMFSVCTGRWVRELQLPWVYRLPDSPFRRLLACLGESVLSYLLEAVLVMVPMGLICGEGAAVIAMGVAARFLLSLLFVGGNLLTERFFGGVKLRAMQVLIYIVFMVILLAPGLMLCLYMISHAHFVIGFTFTIMLWVSLPCLVLTPLAIFLSRGVLNNVELSDR